MFGLIGEKLSHSYSSDIFAILGYPHFNKEVSRDDIFKLLKSKKFKGINVTIPYKQEVIQYLDELDETAKMTGAVNTIKIVGDRLIGFNTDIYGLRLMLQRNKVDIVGKKVLILGSGGTSKTAQQVIKNLGGASVIVSRTGAINYDNVYDKASDIEIIINTTPHGMYPNLTAKSIVDLSKFSRLSFCCDVVFNPKITPLCYNAKKLGIAFCSGLEMLILQAIKSLEIFEDKIEIFNVDLILKSINTKYSNIVIVGMPGSGKSIIGSLIAQKLGKEFVDTDILIEQKTGRKPAQIINENGEAFFREVESEIIKSIATKRQTVIATGGGSVLSETNRYLLSANGTVIFIERDMNLLEKKSRPLSNNSDIESIYKVRYPLYKEMADIVVENNSSVENLVERILGEI